MGRPLHGRGRRPAYAGAAAALAAALTALTAGPLPAALAAPRTPGAPAAPAVPAPTGGGLVMVLDSSGSMAEDDGSGATRIESARAAVGTVVDALPDGYPTGLRVYGADRASGCTDTRLAVPVEELDRGRITDAVADVKPKGDTPIGYALQRAARDLPERPPGALGHRSILLVSDGEDSCGTPDPCEVAEQLGETGGAFGALRIDTVGFQVGGKARDELKCIAEKGHGAYYDAPDADALARQLQRAARLSADGYRFRGDPVEGGLTRGGAADLVPGQYLDSIGAGETKWYAAELDAASAADFGVTAVPQPGVPVAYGDGIELELHATDDHGTRCDTQDDRFEQDEGAQPLTNAVSRVPSAEGGEPCDAAGRYLLSVHRTSDAGSDRARWPLELVFGREGPLRAGVTPAQSEPDYGPAGDEGAALPTADPEDITGGTGFNDAKAIGPGVWRDELLPAQMRFYKVDVGWGQQLRYRVEFANEPTLDGAAGVSSFADTDLYAPGRAFVGDGPYRSSRSYYGEPVASDLGTVPVSWTNRYETAAEVAPVRRGGAYYLSVSLGPDAARFAENTAVGVVLRVDVLGEEKAGPGHGAPAAADGGEQGKDDRDGGKDARAGADEESSDSVLPLAGGIAGGVLLAGAGVAYVVVRNRKRPATSEAAAGNGVRGGW
ncbi:VWA domain-containing protein [Streptomyces sp. WMMC500]|uniref:VWA domain-containing protein n=1 Tax=Streptomyces sp. WMMC500 TaxID=3015154 RepID=UPI00248B3728|nr:VWA domain-containing protein [Streptomyces sp. WMMC500]WBB57892.1 VWA domain-containing protein [Streptomyces sp. WMMC500]